MSAPTDPKVVADALVAATEAQSGPELWAILSETAGGEVTDELAQVIVTLAREVGASRRRVSVELGEDDVVVSRAWVRSVAKVTRRVLSEARQRDVRVARDDEGRVP